MRSGNRRTTVTTYAGHASDAVRDAILSVPSRKKVVDEDEFDLGSCTVDTTSSNALYLLKIDEGPSTPKRLAQTFFTKWILASNLAVERPSSPLSFDSLECEACFLYDPRQERGTISCVSIRGSARAVLGVNPRYDLTNLSHIYHQIESCAEGMSRGGDSSEKRSVCLLLALPRPNFKRVRGYARERGTQERLRASAKSHIFKMTTTSKSVSLRGRSYAFVARTLVSITDLKEPSYDSSGLAYAVFGFIEPERPTSSK